MENDGPIYENTIHIRNIPERMKDNEIIDLFKAFGEVKEIRGAKSGYVHLS